MNINKRPDIDKNLTDFTEELYHFYRASRIPFAYLPKVAGRQLNIQELFNAVVVRGGYKKVCDDQEWPSIAKDLNLPSSCGNISISLRRLYYKSLASFERHKFPNLSVKYTSVMGENSETYSQSLHRFPSNNLENSLGIGFSQRPETLTNNSLLFPGNLLDSSDSGRYSRNDLQYYRSVLPEIQDRCVIPPWDPARPGPTDNSLLGPLRVKEAYELRNIELGLESGLPNEIDMALNILLVKSSSSYNSISLRRNENFLRLLLATIGLIDDDTNSFEACQNFWYESGRLNYVRFWFDHSDETGRKLMRDTLFPSHFSGTSRDFVEEESLFCESEPPNLSLMESAEMTRILHVATILLNLISQPPQSQPNPSSTMNINGNTILIPDADDDIAYQNASLSSPLTGHRPRPLCPLKGGNVGHLVNASPPLSIWRDNARFLSSSPMAISFILLCCYSKDSYLRNLGHQLISSNVTFNLVPKASDYSIELLNRLSNQSDDFLFDNTPSRNIMTYIFASEKLTNELPALPVVSRLALDFLLSCLHSTDSTSAKLSSDLDSSDNPGEGMVLINDRNKFITGLNFLTNLFRVTENTNCELLLTTLPRSIWKGLVDMLVLPDLGIVYSVMEALLAMTCSGYLGCLTLVKSTDQSQLFHILLALLNIEGQALGQKSLHRIKLLSRNIPQPYNQLLLNNQYQTAFLRNNLNSMRNYRMKCQAVERATDYGHKNNPSSLIGLLSCGQTPTKTLEASDPTTRNSPGSNGRASPNKSHNNTGNGGPSSTILLVDKANGHLGQEKEEANGTILPSPIERVLANVTPHPTSLSELSDRLQMPPPSLPPPSVLKRAANKEKSYPGDLKQARREEETCPPPLVNGGSGDHGKQPLLQNGLKKNAMLTEKNNGFDQKVSPQINGFSMPHNGIKSKSPPPSKGNGVTTPVTEETSVLSESWKDPTASFPPKNNLEEKFLTSLDEIEVSNSPSSLDENYLEEINRQIELMDNKKVYFCEWNECMTTFESAENVSKHFYETHFKQSLENNSRTRLNCQWTDCTSPNIPRAKFSLLSHLNEVHCSHDQLTQRSDAIRRHPSESRGKRSQNEGSSGSGSFESYNDQTGLSIIKNVELRRMENEINLNILGCGKPLLMNGRLMNSQTPTAHLPPREGPVTKHLRVTAALILNNLTSMLPETRRFILMEEYSLAEISFGSSPNISNNNGSSMLVRTNDASKIVAQFMHQRRGR